MCIVLCLVTVAKMPASATGFGQYTAIVTAAGQSKSHIGISQEQQSVDRYPGRHMIRLRANTIDLCADVAQGDCRPIDLKPSFGQLICKNKRRRYSVCIRAGIRVASAFHASNGLSGVRSPSK